jgi:hypothetical protein
VGLRLVKRTVFTRHCQGRQEITTLHATSQRRGTIYHIPGPTRIMVTVAVAELTASPLPRWALVPEVRYEGSSATYSPPPIHPRGHALMVRHSNRGIHPAGEPLICAHELISMTAMTAAIAVARP